LRIRASYGLTPEEASRGVYQIGEGIIGKIFETSYPCVVPDIHNEPLFLNRTGARTHLPKGEISFIGVPVVILEKPAGVLTADRLFGPEVSPEEDIRFLTVVAMLIGQFLNLHRAIARKEEILVTENASLKAELRYRYSHHGIIGQSKRIQEVFHAIDKVAPSRATKELVARAIHEASPRREEAFIKVNCAALPEALLESELFGHEKGAFTGAMIMKKGRFELADGGTLFLDEIGEMPLALQTKLLRVLQEKQFERLGGTRTIHVDVRVIAATNRSLDRAVGQGDFRADLYYRLNVVPIVLPPLRERPEDIPLLVDHFIRESNRNNGREVRLGWSVMHFFKRYDWPGNVREMQNLIERLVIMADQERIEIHHLPAYMVDEPNPRQAAGGWSPADITPGVAPALAGSEAAASGFLPGRETSGIPTGGLRPARCSLKELEKQQIEAALERHGWVQARAARELGLTQRQIGYKIRKYRLSRPAYPA